MWTWTMNLCCWSVLVWLALGVSLIASDSVIEEVSDRQLEKMVEENDFVAVAWFTKNCKYVFTVRWPRRVLLGNAQISAVSKKEQRKKCQRLSAKRGNFH
jgi:hypothetical protein